MRNKQTAVNWLERELVNNMREIIVNKNFQLMKSIFQKAKQIEKRQIMKAWDEGEELELQHYLNNTSRRYYKFNYGTPSQVD